jgi:hypothetical protein
VFALLSPFGGGCSDGGVDAAPAPPPALHQPDRVVFAAVGDTGKGGAAQERVAGAIRSVCAEVGCDFVLLLGDNLYPVGMVGPDDPRADALIGDPYAPSAPVYLVLGNHDWANDDPQVARWQLDWAARREGVAAPAHAWSFEAGPLLLAGVDTNAVFQGFDSLQERWLQETLAASDAPWKVVAGHHPLRSDGPHGNAGAYEGWPYLPWLSGRSVAAFLDAAVCGRADLYLAGHDHTRQLLEACGVQLVVAGTGASGTRIVDRGNHPVFADVALGFALFTLDAAGGEVAFYGADGEVDAAFPLDR